jgi:protocatechuate 3,4-dioxygenase beta subunit
VSSVREDLVDGDGGAQSPPGSGAALLAIVLLMLSALLTSRCDDQTTAHLDTQEATAVQWPETRPDSAPRVLRGLALRELPVEEEQAGTHTSSRPSAESLADPELEGMFDSLPPWTLAPPPTCRVQGWQDGEPIGLEVGCDDEGRYALSLPGELAGIVHVEVLIPGHLRGVLEVDLATQADAQGHVELPTLALGPGFTIAGQTLNARGQPLANVSVQALPRPSIGEPIPWRTSSDEQGRFELTSLPYGPINLRAIKPGYALSVVEALSPEDSVLMVLDELIDLEGAVVADAELLARAQVRLEGSSVWPAIEQPLAADGSFVFERLPDGIYGVEVIVPASEPGGQEFASIPLENITPDLHIDLALVPAFRVPVRVVDPGRQPVEGARVILGYGSLGMLQKTAQTDAQGRVQIGPVVPGPYVVQADADGFLPPAAVEVEVGPSGFEGEELVLVLIRPARISGIVVDEDDRPVEGAEVLLDSDVAFSVGEGDNRRQLFAVAVGSSDGSLGVTRGNVPDIPLFAEGAIPGVYGVVVTDDDGHFSIDPLLPGSYRIWASHGMHAASGVVSFDLHSGEIRGNLRLQLRSGVPLTGVVRSANGTPIADVQIDLGDGMILTTDERGVFDAGFRRGAQQLIVRGPGMIPKVVEVELGESPLDIEVELEPAEGRFEGRVVDGNGRPIADVEVELRPLDGLSPSVITWTDARGVYEFEQLAPGPVEIDFNHRDYVPTLDTASVDESSGLTHEITLDAGWSAHVLVRSAVRGDPLADVELHTEHASATTDRRGLATLERLVGDAVEVEVRADGWVGKTVGLRDDGSGRVEVTIELVEGGSIEGTIDDDIGEPVAGADIDVRSPSGEVLGVTSSDGRGRWRIDGIDEACLARLDETPLGVMAVEGGTIEFEAPARAVVTVLAR